MDLKMEWEDLEWIFPAEDRNKRRAFVNTVMNLRFPQKSKEFPNWLINFFIKTFFFKELVC